MILATFLGVKKLDHHENILNLKIEELKLQINNGKSSNMKAVVLSQHGNISQLKHLEDFPDPQIKEGHVVIKVKSIIISLLFA